MMQRLGGVLLAAGVVLGTMTGATSTGAADDDRSPRPGFDLQVGQPGASPWLGGIDIDDFGGSLVRAAKSFGADAISPGHGDPQGGSVIDPGYQPFTTKEMVDEAHAAGMKIITWTVDDIATMNRLIDIGVDGIITDYPDRLRDLLKTRGHPLPRRFEVHR